MISSAPMRVLLILLGILCAVTPAHADETAPLYAVVAIEVSGDADPTLRAQVQAGLERGVNEAGADLLGYDDVQKALAGKAALIGCTSKTCLASIAEVVDQLCRDGAVLDQELLMDERVSFGLPPELAAAAARANSAGERPPRSGRARRSDQRLRGGRLSTPPRRS